ncbi:hypothetical protein FVB27_11760, partial [Escherichia coli]
VFVWKQNYILVDEYFFFCCTWIVNSADKKRPNTIPVFGPGKWLLGESRALKVGINAGLVALPFKNR